MNQELHDLILDVREQVLYLRELGVDMFDITMPERVGSERLSGARQEAQMAALIPTDALNQVLKSEISKLAEHLSEPGSRLSSLPSLSKRQFFGSTQSPETGETPETPETGGSIRTSDAPETLKRAEAATLFGDIAPTLPEPVETIEQIRTEIGANCARCHLHALGRSKVVNSVGNSGADLMFVGEAPGADEDAQGEPFVGKAGQLLTKIIEGIGLRREDVFIGNINRCRPPGNRAPEPAETAACRPFLLREIAVVRPKVIVVLGATAAHNLLETKVPISKLRGNFQDYLGVKVMPTFHPAYLLRDPHKKREVWEDMKKVRDFLASQS